MHHLKVRESIPWVILIIVITYGAVQDYRAGEKIREAKRRVDRMLQWVSGFSDYAMNQSSDQLTRTEYYQSIEQLGKLNPSLILPQRLQQAKIVNDMPPLPH
jgi:hypothetical protein